MSWPLTILGLVLLIVLHELGHFVAAKALGMRVERFSLFFPPTIARVRRGETEYAIGAIPAGGYVKITGMNPEELGDLEPEVRRRAYYSQSPWKRIVVILAGPLVNIVIAFVVFAGVLMSNNVHGHLLLGELDHGVSTVVPNTEVAAIEQGKPAAAVLRPGDRIVSADGRPATVASVRAAIDRHSCAGPVKDGCVAATPVHLTVRRAGRLVPISVYPRYEARARRMIIGFGFGLDSTHFGAADAASSAARQMGTATVDMITGLGRALTNSKEREKVSSIIGISEAANRNFEAGAGQALVFIGYFSLILGVLNLFPFLPLDGGHIMWSLAEKIRGRRVSLMAMYRFSSVGIVLMLFLVLNGVSNDISRLAG